MNKGMQHQTSATHSACDVHVTALSCKSIALNVPHCPAN